MGRSAAGARSLVHPLTSLSGSEFTPMRFLLGLSRTFYGALHKQIVAGGTIAPRGATTAIPPARSAFPAAPPLRWASVAAASACAGPTAPGLDKEYVLTLVGKDRIGAVHDFTVEVNKHGGNFEESRMVRLGGAEGVPGLYGGVSLDARHRRALCRGVPHAAVVGGGARPEGHRAGGHREPAAVPGTRRVDGDRDGASAVCRMAAVSHERAGGGAEAGVHGRRGSGAVSERGGPL
eukprot:ctg_1623.g517